MQKIKKIIPWFSTLIVKKSDTLTNPYVKDAEGQRVWNDRYGTLHQSLRLWQIAFFAALMTNAVLGGMLGYVSATSKVQPFVVETHEGMPYAIAPMRSISTHDQRLMNFAINQFILNARTVVHDNEAQKALLDKVYAYAANQTLPFLHDYYQNHNPFEIAMHSTVTPTIVSSLPMSCDTWQITWDETERNVHEGSAVKTTRWVANVTYQLGDVNTRFITHNPFGFYITQVAWTQSHPGEAS